MNTVTAIGIDHVEREMARQHSLWAALIAQSDALAAVIRELPPEATAQLQQMTAHLHDGPVGGPCGAAGLSCAAYACRA